MTRIIDNDPMRVGKWVCERAGGNFTGGTAIGLEKDGDLVAGVIYEVYNGASVFMHVAGTGKYWMNREFLWFAFYYPFNQLKVNKVLGVVGGGMENVLDFDQHLGFVIEHRIKDAHPTGDMVILSMTRAQCRFLEPRYGRRIRRQTNSPSCA